MLSTAASPAITSELVAIASVCVTGLLSLLGYVLKSSKASEDRSAKREDERVRLFTDTVRDLDERHRSERSEWHAEAKARESRANEVLDGFHATIKEILQGPGDKAG